MDSVNTFDDNHWLKLASVRAASSAATGGGPFGAVLVKGDQTFIDNNHVTELNDPTAHAEVSVIRKACAALGTFNLEGWTLYSSCEPCPMCLGAALWSRVDRIVFNANRNDAAAAGFDDSKFYDLLENGDVAEEHRTVYANHPFEVWGENQQRTDY